MTQTFLRALLLKMQERYIASASACSCDSIAEASQLAKAEFAGDLADMLSFREEDLFSFSELDEASHVEAYEARNVERRKGDCFEHVIAFNIHNRATEEDRRAFEMRAKFDAARRALQKAGKL